MDTIYKRRSIRRYTDMPVPTGIIDSVIKAAMNAPSAGNEQPWHFVVIEDRKILKNLTTVHPHANMLLEAPVAVLVCGDLDLEKHKDYWVQDCAAATQNLLLAATTEGLGSVWLGVHPRRDREDGIRRILGLPDHVIPFSLIPLGYPGEIKPAKNEFHRERIHHNHW